MEAIYDDVPRPLGLARFAPVVPARGALFGARRRLGVPGEAALPPAVPEDALAAGG
jgi:hypothetical protein